MQRINRMRLLSFLKRLQRPLLLTLLAAHLPCSTRAQDSANGPATAIADRPEKLKFLPLDYQPPKPEEYRVQLPSGPVAYVIPDRELPLVNVVVYMRAGSYLVPPGKESLADLTGYLLARGGTQSKSANDLDERLSFLAA